MSAEVGLPRFSPAPSISPDKDFGPNVPRTFGWGHAEDPTQPVRDEDRTGLGRGASDLAQGRHASPTRSQQFVSAHGARFTRFSVIGGGIFVAGLALQAGLTAGLHMPSFVSYVIQSVVSIEASFVLNRRFTWHERDSAFWPALLRFNLQKTLTVAANLALYAVLLRVGLNYLLANILLTAVFTVVNYVGGDRFVFTPRRTGADPELASQPGLQTMPFPAVRGTLPRVSVVIPCRANEGTIRATVDSLLRQDYPNLQEIILIGSPVDTTWDALMGLRDPRLAIMEVEAPPGIRDANFKRDIGIRRSTSDLIALIDSDMVVPDDWMSRAVTTLSNSGADCVAGVMRSIRDDFWGRYVDNCRLGAKTPRVADSYFVTADDFGSGSHKPPITANVLFTREAYERCPIDSSWSHGSLEDYEWFWRVVDSGHRVLVTDRLYGWHHHRAGLSRLAAEYRRSARGCAYFIRAHRQSPFARKRLIQAITLPLAAAATLAGVVTAGAMGRELQTVGLLGVLAFVAALVLSGREFAHSRTLESLAYPLPALVLGFSYTASLVTHLVRSPKVAVVVSNFELPQKSALQPTRARRSVLSRLIHPLTAILALQTALSLCLVWSNTIFGDEADYLDIGHLLIANWQRGTWWPSQYAHAKLSGSPYIYPPIGAIADSLGGIAGARILSLVFMLCATVLLYSTTSRLFGQNSAIVASALWAVSEPALRLAFATYDPLSVLLTTVSAWIILRARDGDHRGELVASAAIVLALANVTAYSGIIIDPIIVAFAIVVWRESMRFRTAIYCGMWFCASVILVVVAIMTETHCWSAIITTVFSRNAQTLGQASDITTIPHVISDAWTYAGFTAVLAFVGLVVAIGAGSRRALIAVLCAALSIVPLAQAHDHVAVSMDKHLAYGLWFGAIAAGYGCMSLLHVAASQIRRAVLTMCGLAVLFFPAANGWQAAQHVYKSWPNNTAFTTAILPIIEHRDGPFYVSAGDRFVQIYSTSHGTNWGKWNSIPLAAPYGPSLRKANYQIIITFYVTSINSPDLPSEMLLTQDSSSLSKTLLDTVGANERDPGLGALTIALEKDRSYRLVATGPSNSNKTDGIYAIWVHA